MTAIIVTMLILAYLLILSLCLNGLAGATSTWLQTARAETKSEKQYSKSEKKNSSKSGSNKKASKKSEKTESEDKTTSQDGKKNSQDGKKTKVKKEKEYKLDLAENNQVALSVVLEYAKMGIKLKEVKSIEYEDKKDKKLHGYGYRSMKKAASKYGGDNMDFKLEDGTFTLRFNLTFKQDGAA